MDNNFNSQVGARIRELRTGQRLTRETLAEAADISIQFLSDIEFGKKGMSALTLKKLCTALSVSADYILFGSDEKRDTAAVEGMLKALSEKQFRSVEEILRIIISATT